MLDIYSQDSNNLIFLYYKLFNFDFQTSSAKNLIKMVDRFDLAHLIKMWKKFRKTFNGKQFVDYLKKNPPDHDPSKLFDKDEAIRYAQSLLESSFMISLPSKSEYFFSFLSGEAEEFFLIQNKFKKKQNERRSQKSRQNEALSLRRARRRIRRSSRRQR